jgi:DNA-binding MarR family transcriptional regulator
VAIEPRLGYLLKHAQLQYNALVSAALTPLGVEVREWAALLCLDDDQSLSQAEVAHLLGIDRTTMVALVDELQAKGYVRRRPHDDDRRKNVVELTPAGRRIKQRAARLVDDTERRYLAVLSRADREQLKRSLETLIARD